MLPRGFGKTPGSGNGVADHEFKTIHAQRHEEHEERQRLRFAFAKVVHHHSAVKMLKNRKIFFNLRLLRLFAAKLFFASDYMMLIFPANRAKKTSSFLTVLSLLLFVSPAAFSETADSAAPPPPTEAFSHFEVVFEPDAYYTDLELIIPLTQAPIQHLGEKSESEIYRALLSKAAVFPRFLVIEASVNPMPSLGVYIKKNHPDFYDDAQISGSFNWIQAITAGFEEPYALSLFAGNVMSFDVPESTQIKGNGYSGYLFSTGNYHIKNNTLIQDRWEEFEWKMKGDRKSPIKKLSWSFRVGAKLHENPNITDIFYLSFRRSRIDYKPDRSSLFNNSGFEYTLDLDRKTFTPTRHYFYVDKKWPLENKQMAFALAVGFVWQSAGSYTGPLATTEGTGFQFLLRPNIEF